MTTPALLLCLCLIFAVGCSSTQTISSGSFQSAQTAALKTKPPASTQPITIVLVGDSTVTEKSGWGAGFAKRVGPEVKVINTAAGGRSSKSFRDEGKWDDTLKNSGQYMLIQFGHNDQPGKGPERETIAGTTFKANMVRYVTEARAAGFTPILVTSLVRRKFEKSADGKTIKSDLVEYVEGTKAAARETGCALIDLHAVSLVYFNKLGRAESERLAPRDSKDPNKVDSTHLDGPLGDPVGQLVVDELAKVEPELASRLKTSAGQ